MTKQALTIQRVFWFWVPLALVWLMMSFEQPSITAGVSRLPDATRNLAAFGLAFSFGLIMESPIIMLLTASTALATTREAYQRLMRFTHLLVALLTALHLILVLTPLYAYILRVWIGAPEAIIETSRIALLLVTPATAGVAYRRIWEGVMIRFGYPQRVTQVILVRLVVTLVLLFGGLAIEGLQGAYIGSIAWAGGIMGGMVAAAWFVRPTLNSELPPASEGDEPLTWAGLTSFYMPLALTSLIMMLGGPILSFGLSRAPQPLESLAVWPVVMSLLFVGRSVGIAYQEVVVALLKDQNSFIQLRRFTGFLAGGTTGLFALLALTPGAGLWYRYVAGLEPELVSMAIWPTAILALVPGLGAIASWQRGLLIHKKQTGVISIAMGLNIGSLLVMMLIAPHMLVIPGAIMAASVLALSTGAEVLFLWWSNRESIRTMLPARVSIGD
jgi:progressive ankylosis protein